MALYSFSFFVFLAAAIAAAFTLPGRWRPAVLLGASLLFYASSGISGLVFPLYLIAVTHLAANGLAAQRSSRARLMLLWAAILFAITPLVATKYFGLVAPLPLGVSFLTLQAIGFLADTYFDQAQPERSPFGTALFLLYFPVVTAGPIERAQGLLPQLKAAPEFSYARLRQGSLRIFVGIFKKLVIADTLAGFVTAAYADPAGHSPYSLYFATVLARYQIFADFSGYSDIAIGASWILGIRLTENFVRPFASTSVVDHWRRWHISLSTWVRDYIMGPLITSRASVLGFSGAVVLTFLALGLWHGATLNFVCYGLIYGLLIALHEATRKGRKKMVEALGLSRVPRLHHAFQIAFTFCVVVVLPTVFFRASTFSQAMKIYGAMFRLPAGLPSLNDGWFMDAAHSLTGVYVLALIVILEILQWADARRPLDERLQRLPSGARWLIYAVTLAVFALLGRFGGGTDFIYRHF
jgi:alginate O-acetyltransferase complex protein AlgI